MKLDFSDATKLQTRGQFDFQICHVDANSVHGLIRTGTRGRPMWDYDWSPIIWALNGEVRWALILPGLMRDSDLIPKPAPPRTGECWLNAYTDKDGTLCVGSGYRARQTADERVIVNRVGCIRVELVEGQFDD